MRGVFEQFQFIPRMFNTASVKVQDNGVWSIIWSSIIWLVSKIVHFTVDIVGVSIMYAIVLFIVMVLDFITGFQASKKEWPDENPGKKFRGESKKGLRWVIKYFVYITGFFIINVMVMEVGEIDMEHLDKLLNVNVIGIIVGIFSITRVFLMLYILRWELTSIDENFERLGFDFKIFGFFTGLIHSVSDIFKNKTGVDFNKKKEDDK
ncbi:MAG: phage holin family protein [Proteiniphilum sp.]